MDPLRRGTPWWIPLALMLLTAGCGTHHYWVSRHMKRSVQLHAAQLHLARCKARVHKEVLEVWVDLKLADDAYRSDLLLEESATEQMTMAVAYSEVVFDQRWNTLRLDLYTRYGGMRWHSHFGTYIITLPRVAMDRIRAHCVDTPAVAQLWTRVLALKQGPNHEVIEWPADPAQPLRR